jgi:hypothetical protein
MEGTDTSVLPENIKSHLPEHLVTELFQAIDDAKLWSSKLPEQSMFYLNKVVTIRRPIDIPPEVRHRDIILADVFFDVHSMLSTLVLLKSWRLGQLAAGLANAVQSWNLSVGASIARALLETASAWGVESRDLARAWAAVKSRRIATEDEAMKGRSQMMRASMQMCWGTRIQTIHKDNAAIRRTNVLTLVAKAAKLLDHASLEHEYEILCDAVHPSWGSNECFWHEAGECPEPPQSRVLVSKDAVGWIDTRDTAQVRPGSPVAGIIIETSAWAIRTMLADLFAFERMCRDLCLSARVYLLPSLNYWGVVVPTAEHEPCACGSGNLTKSCPHSFGAFAPEGRG